MSKKIYISDLDVIYLSYDEPKKDEYWLNISNNIHWAKRVDGVKGSDTAHKAAANMSSTERFILIDGDNLPDFSFFDKVLDLNEKNKNAVFRWRAKNVINNLHYGNGGLSCWTKDYVLNMKTHENSNGDEKANIEFCFDPLYWPMHDCYSTTCPNQSPKQAWRAGFREGVKLCTRSGVKPKTKNDFNKWVWKRNLKNLLIWQTIGRDVENGFWAILGARLGTYYLMLQDWDYLEVQDFDCLEKLWEIHKKDDEHTCVNIGKELSIELDIMIPELSIDISRYIKNNIMPAWENKGIMEREYA